jgi:hypothetical protein
MHSEAAHRIHYHQLLLIVCTHLWHQKWARRGFPWPAGIAPIIAWELFGGATWIAINHTAFKKALNVTAVSLQAKERDQFHCIHIPNYPCWQYVGGSWPNCCWRMLLT